MKEKLSPVLEKWFYTQSPLVITRPAIRECAVCVGLMLSGFVLSCGNLAGRPAPFALALVAAAGGGIRGLCCLLGAAAGYLTMQEFSQGLEMASSGILIYICAYVFDSLWVARTAWFPCVAAAVMTAAVGLIFLLSQPLTAGVIWGYGQTVLLAGVMPLCYGRLMREKKRSAGALPALASFILGAAAIPLPLEMCLGTVAAVALTAAAVRRAELYTAAALAAGCGLGLDAALYTGGFWTVTLCCGGLIGTAAKKRYGILRVVLFAVGFMGASLYTGTAAAMIWATLAAGVVLSFLLPAGLIAGREISAVEEAADLVEQRLSGGGDAFLRLYDAVDVDPQEREERDKNRIFDRAAAQVCRRCNRYGQCWEKNAAETVSHLRPVVTAVAERGTVCREDFPEEFSMECRLFEGFLTAVNEEADGILLRNQRRARAREERVVVSRVLLHVGRMLEKNARRLRSSTSVPEEAFSYCMGVAARGRRGAKISGDRGLSFQTEEGMLYVMLCDGAGTGEAAAGESLLAVDTLADLILAGMPVDSAMELVSGTYILRQKGCFSTMDVLEVSLMTGQGALYKWGAAPSYLKSGNSVKKLGTAAPPPGLGIGGTYGPEVMRLNLWGGDLLVLVSDGVIREETETLLKGFEGENVKALANALIDCAATAGGEDDMTAVAVQIQQR